MSDSIEKLALRVAREMNPGFCTDEGLEGYADFLARCLAELAKQQELAAVVISEVSDADREKIAEALARSVGTFGKLGTASSLYKQPADDRIKELERQRDELLAALGCMVHLCEIIAAPEGPVLDKARAAIANVKGGAQ